MMTIDSQAEARALADDLRRRASNEQIVMHYHARQADKLAAALAAKEQSYDEAGREGAKL
jgi:hypothetical protein